MQGTVILCTDRLVFEQHWRATFARQSLDVRVCHPAALGSASSDSVAVLFDGSSRNFVDDDDELLSGVGFVRALDIIAAAVLPEEERFDDVADLVGDLCGGLVGRADIAAETLTTSLERRLQRQLARRFELVGVSPREGEVLAILSNRRALLVPRPLSSDDDATDIESIELVEDDTAAELRLASGMKVVLRVAEVVDRAARSLGAVDGSSSASGKAIDGEQGDPVGTPMDGAHLGARIRALRIEAGLTQAEVARRTGIHRPNIARVEGGRHTPSIETLTRLAEAIGIPATRVFSDD